MLQYSKVQQSRKRWKEKAIKRGELNRQYKQSIKQYKNTVAELKEIVASSKKYPKKNSSISSPVAPLKVLSDRQNIRTLCILLIIQGVVSYRSVPRILKLFNTVTPMRISWIPHFSSVINWSLRFGIGKLQQVKPIDKPWIAILDHSIDIGTKKAFVVLRVLMDVLSKKGKAIQLSDCECINISIAETVNGDSIALELNDIFQKAGAPSAILKDCDSTLQKGVRLYCESQGLQLPIIEDVGHVIGSSLKAEFEDNEKFKSFTTLANKSANKLRQTHLAYLKPPQLRTKGRFMSISKLGSWAEKMLRAMSVKGRAKKGSILEKMRRALPGFTKMKPFIVRFSKSTKITADIMELLKNKGLDKNTYEKCIELIGSLPPNSKVQIRLQNWLNHHYSIQNELTSFPLLVSSDIIESLFGKFKHVMERSSQADMNRTALLIPALCGIATNEQVTEIFNLTEHKDIKDWEDDNVSYTLRKQRQQFFSQNTIQKAG